MNKLLILLLLLTIPIFGEIKKRTKMASQREKTIVYEPAGVCGGFITFEVFKCYDSKKGFWHIDNDKCLRVIDVYDPPCVKEVK